MNNKSTKKQRIYLDYASTTPVDPDVVKAMMPYFGKHFGNPSALHKEGVVAQQAVRESRATISKLLNVRSEEIIFTGSGTEADNLALWGLYQNYKRAFKPHIITTNIEHPGIIEICKAIEADGGEVTYIPVNANGIVNPYAIFKALKPTTVLVSVICASNEIGVIQPIRDIARAVLEYKKNAGLEPEHFPFVHTDASQAANYLDLSFQKLGVDMLTLDASKMYGPKGIGLLAVKSAVPLKPLIYGGGQEKGLRSGTENVAFIVGCAHAFMLAQKKREKESERLEKLRDYFFDTVINKWPSVSINGDRVQRLPNNVNICVPGIDAEFAVIQLDHHGIAASSASSCINLKEESYSYVVDALGDEGKKCRASSLRFTFGRQTTKKDIDLTLRVLNSIITTQ